MIGPALAAFAMIISQAAVAQAPTDPPQNASTKARSPASPQIEKCLDGDHYSCVMVLKVERARLTPAAIHCIQDLALEGMNDSHPIATPECRSDVLGH